MPWLFALAVLGLPYHRALLLGFSFGDTLVWSLVTYWVAATFVRWVVGRLLFAIKFRLAAPEVCQAVDPTMASQQASADNAGYVAQGVQLAGGGDALGTGVGVAGLMLFEWFADRKRTPEQRRVHKAASRLGAERSLWTMFSGYLAMACVAYYLIATW